MTKSLNVRTEAWLKGSHSFSLVHRFQMQALLIDRSINFHHREQIPLHPGQHEGHDQDFSLGSFADVSSLLKPPGRFEPAVVYRLLTPTNLRIPEEGCPLVSYLVTELGLGITRFADNGGDDIKRFEAHGGAIHTPTQWSKQRIVNGGFPERIVHVIPNGVNADLYFPMDPKEIELIRRQQGFSPDDVILLNVGSPVWNKGLDVLVRCFAKLRIDHPKLYLLLKDQSSVYGIGVKEQVQQILQSLPASVQAKAFEGIRVIPAFLSFRAMRHVMNAADIYVSPYRAEGFNMPVLEAIACGTRAVVSSVGSTSDFCCAENAALIEGRLFESCEIQGRPVDAYFEPNIESLHLILSALINTDPSKRKLQASIAAKASAQFSWQVTAKALAALFRSMI